MKILSIRLVVILLLFSTVSIAQRRFANIPAAPVNTPATYSVLQYTDLPSGLFLLGATNSASASTDLNITNSSYFHWSYTSGRGSFEFNEGHILFGVADPDVSEINQIKVSTTTQEFHGLSLVSTSLNGNVSLVVSSDDGQLVVNDNRGTKTGLQTAASGYVTSPRSYTDKEYVDALISVSRLFRNGNQAVNSGTSETDLHAFTIPVNTINSDDKVLTAEYAGTFSDGTATHQLKAYFAGQEIFDTGAIGATGSWKVEVSIIRTGSATCKAITTITVGTSSYANWTSLTGIDYTSTNIIKITGTAGGGTGGSGDINCEMSFGNIHLN